MEKFVDETHLHGIKEFYNARTFFKVVWVLIILGSTGACIFETYKVIQEYIEMKPVTQISSQAPLKFPPAMFCPPDWINGSAVEALGISEQMLMYGLGYLSEFSSAIKDEHPMFTAVEENLTTIKTEFNALFKNNFETKFDQFVKDVSISSSSIKCENCKDGSPWARITSSGTCYLMEFKELKDPFLQQRYRFTYVPMKNNNLAKKYGWLEGDTENDESKFAKLYLGNAVSEYMPLDYVTLLYDEPVRIRYTAALHKRMNTNDQPCFQVEDKSFDNSTVRDQFRHCQSICLAQLFEECGNNQCQIWMPVQRFERRLTKPKYCDFQDNIDQVCDDLDDADRWQKIYGITQKCLKQCVPPCTEWTFTYAKDINIELYYVKNVEKAEDGKFFAASFTFLNPMGSLVFTEKDGYTWDTLVSNVGGQLGLWLGASIMSFFQAIYLFYIGGNENAKKKTKTNEHTVWSIQKRSFDFVPSNMTRSKKLRNDYKNEN